MMLVVQEGDYDNFVDAAETLEQGPVDEPLAVVNAVIGSQGDSTLRIEGFIKRQRVEILIDTGSTHNVVNTLIARKLRLPLRSDQMLRVSVAGGRTINMDKWCKGLQWSMVGTTFGADFIVLDIGRFDMILGAQWLRQLGKIVLDMDQLSMAFCHQGCSYELHGLALPKVDPIESQLGLQDLSTAQHVFLVQEAADDLLRVCQDAELSPSQQSQLAMLLSSFSDIFTEPTSLPPQRNFDHHIPLKSEEPVSCRPYRYGPVQKNEIENQVQQMLSSGVIHPSQSPFAALVVLVHKKDGSRRFCVDYR